MRLWWELTRRSFRRWSTYRAAMLGGLVPNVVFGYIRAYILLAVIAEAGTIGGFDEAAVVTYSFATQALIAPIAIFGGGGADMGLAERVRSGDVVADLYRPVDFQLYWLSQDLGRAAFSFLARSVASFTAGFLAFDLVVPTTPGQIAASVVVLALAVVVSFGWRFLIALTAFWLLDDRGVVTVAGAAAMFFSGFIVPLTFFPGWLQAVAAALPLQAMVQLPIEVFLGLHGAAGIAGVIATQLFWIAVLGVAGRAVAALAVRKVVVQGG
jgi:ABC-2 type transport system permease protein